MSHIFAWFSTISKRYLFTYNEIIIMQWKVLKAAESPPQKM